MYRYYLPQGCVLIGANKPDNHGNVLEEQVISEPDEQYSFTWIDGEWKPVPNVNVIKLTVTGGVIDESEIYTNSPIPLELHVSDMDIGTDCGYEPKFDSEMYG